MQRYIVRVGAFLMPPMQYRHPPERYTLRGGVSETRVLIAFEDEYRTYTIESLWLALSGHIARISR